MNLQEHAGLVFAAQRGVDFQHRALHEIGGGPLDGRVHGGPFGGAARCRVLAVDVRQIAAAPEHRLHHPAGAGLRDGVVEPLLHLPVAGEVALDDVRRFALLQSEAVSETESREAVGDAVVDHLRDVALAARDLRRRDAERLAGDAGVEILARFEARAQHRIAGDVGEHAQLDLRIIGTQELPARLGNERLADLRTDGRADGNVLQIGVHAGEPARRGDRLIEGGVQAPVPADHGRQCVEVRALQLRQLPVLEHLRGQRMLLGELLQNLLVGGGARLSPFEDRQVQLLVEDLGELLRRGRQELAAGELVDLF